MNRLLSICVHALVFVLIGACKKDEPAVNPPSGGTPMMGSTELSFKLMANGKTVEDSTDYYNFAGDTFSISMFNYYVSNIVMTRSDGQKFVEKESYHLIKHF